MSTMASIIKIGAVGFKLAASKGTNMIVKEAIKPVMDEAAGSVVKTVCIRAAELGLAGATANFIDEYVDKKISNTAKFIDNLADILDKMSASSEDSEDE